MQFWKMNGAGNDFIIIDNIREQIPVERFGDLARLLCERHLSIGADGLMVVEPARGDADYRMLFYNSAVSDPPQRSHDRQAECAHRGGRDGL